MSYRIVTLVILVSAASPWCFAEPPGANRADEAIRSELSLPAAVEFVDSSAQHWQQERRCVTCHTNGVYLITRAEAGTDAPAYIESRRFARQYLKRYIVDGKRPAGGYGAIEGIVSTTSFLAISEVKSTGTLSPFTRQALDHIWKLQSEDGSWNEWLKCHWGPYEVDDHFGVTLAALAVGMAPEDYRSSPTAKEGLAKLRRYLQNNPPATGHQKAMTLWAAQYNLNLATDDQQRRWTDQLLALQHDDGGWAIIDLGDEQWQQEQGKLQDHQSDGYGTGFVIYVLRQAGRAVEDVRLVRGKNWLEQNQRQSGRWFTRSPRRDGKHYITQAATNFAIAALVSMGHESEVAAD